jgi:transcriptional regulator with XRE-family HTH domain
MPDETMGQRFKRLREAAGLTQEALARAADVSLGAVRNWEQDLREPLLGTAARVADAIGVSLDALAGRPAPKPAPKRPRKKK